MGNFYLRTLKCQVDFMLKLEIGRERENNTKRGREGERERLSE